MDANGADSRFLGFIHLSGETVEVVAPDGKLLYANPAFGRLFGYGPETVASGLNVFELVHPDERFLVQKHVGLALDGEARRVEYRFRRADGSWRWVEGVMARLEGDSEVRGVVINVRDVESRRESEASLRHSEGRLRQFLDRIAEALIIHDKDGQMVECNAEACRSLGYTREELLSMSVRDFATGLLSDEEREAAGGDTLWRKAVARDDPGVVGYHRGLHRRKDGSLFPVEVAVSSADYGGKRLILATCRDVTEYWRLEKELEYRVTHDHLTGLLNRGPFAERLERSMARAGNSGDPVSLLFVDLDDFKAVNSAFGHEAGDAVLTGFAGLLRRVLSLDNSICRLGGEEFLVLLDGVGLAGAERAARRILQALRDPVPTDNNALEARIEASIGLACAAGDAESAEDLIRRAEQAMYRAKSRVENAYST